MIFVSFSFIVTGVCIALYGWGLLFQQLAKCPIRNWVLTITIGLGVIIFLGGVLNLLRLAYGWVFDVLLVVGIVLAAKYGKFRLKLPRVRSELFYAAIPGLLIALIMYFTVKTQLPPQAFNWHDDFEKYFAHPVRMLQTGTLFGSPLNALGSETLGGQAILHGIVLNHFPVQYINGVDAVFGLLLCLLLTVSIFQARAAFLPMALISPLVVFFINPQYVNVSALYIGSAFMMTSILLFSDISEYGDNEETEKLPSPILTGLIYAAIVSLKSIFVMFPLLHLSFFAITLKIFGVDFRRLVRWCLITAGVTLLFLLPWIFLYLPYYVHSSFVQAPHRTDITVTPVSPLNLLSARPMPYGATFAHYTFISMATALSVLGVALLNRGKRSNALAGLIAGSAAIIVAYLSLLALSPAISGHNASLRYSVPFLIAGTSTVLSLVYLRALKDGSLGFKLSSATIPLLLGVFTIVGFSESLMERIHQGYESGSILAFSKLAANREYIRYNEEVIHGDTKSRVITAQKQIPSGQSVVAWVSTPFYLDYKRNTIYDAERSGIATPWAHILDVEYFLFEYGGPAVIPLSKYLHPNPGRRERYISEKCIVLLQFFQQLRQNADELYDDGNIVVLKKHRTDTKRTLDLTSE